MPPEFAPEFANISVIMPAYQAVDTIGRTLASITTQTLKPREVIIVDDGSEDGTFEKAESLGPEMGGIGLKVIRQDHQGAGAARNRAIAESNQPYLAFLDADDEWLPEKLERSMAFMEGSDFVLVAHDYITGEGDQAVHHDCVRRFKETQDPFIGLYRKGYIPSSSVVTRRDAVVSVGGFDPSLANAQDFDLWLALLREPETPFLVFGEPLLRYHITPGGIMSHTNRRLHCTLEIALRYFPDLESRPGSALLNLWFRILALHREAFRAHRKRGNITNLLLTAGLFPFRILGMTIKALFLLPTQRRDFLSAHDG
ncbi:MAG: glycosyltransferase family 2 protein [Rhodospirillales bacterium]|nr:glycosyltransferase family 2 protein [Rhodospirillales bacterium]